jgi:hypothetical protein
MKVHFGKPILLALLITFAILDNSLFAQVKSSAITGTVTDQSGAVVAGAKVTVTETQTSAITASQTNDEGQYNVPYLPIGRYTVEVQAAGFQTYRRTDINLAGATTLRADVSMAVGNTTATVEIKADALALQTETATVSTAVSTETINNLPNINGNSLYYATLDSGVVGTPQQMTSTNLGVGYMNRRDMSGLRINGGAIGSNDVQLDGISVQGAAWHETSVLPNPDALSEVRVTTNNFTADIGMAQGVVSQTTKSGTNKFHGDLNYMIRNEALNANSFGNKHQGIARPTYRLLQGGGSIGGPVIIPHIYNGSNKLFFFVSFLRLTHSDAITLLTTVPTALERQGNFSSTLVKEKSSGQAVPVHIYNPYVATPVAGSNGTLYQRQQYANAIVTNPNQYGLKILQGYPMPNFTSGSGPSIANGGGQEPYYHTNNYYFSGIQPINRNSLNTRVDFKPTDSQSIFFSAGFSKGTISNPNQWGANSPFVYQTNQGDVHDFNPYGAIGDTFVLNPTTVLDVRYGVTRINTQAHVSQAKGNPADYGMPAFVSAVSPLPGSLPSMPAAATTPYGALNNNSYGNKNEHQTNHFVVGSLSKQLAKHSLKVGAEYRVYLQNFADYQWQSPILSVGSTNGIAVTGQYATASGANSSTIATTQDSGFLPAGIVAGAQGWSMPAGTAPVLSIASKYTGFYGQDSWRPTPKLQLNIGVRYEVQPGPTERHNKMSSYVLDAKNPFAAGATGNPAGGLGLLTFPGVDGYSRNLYETNWNNVSPRLGFTYQLNGKTVVRGGYGRNYLPSNTGFNANTTIYNPMPWDTAVNAIPFGLSPAGVAVGSFDQPSNTYVVKGPGPIQDPANYGQPGTVTIFNRKDYKTGHTDQWNIFIERQLSPTWIVNAGYVGSSSSTLPWRGYLINGPHNVDPGQLSAWRAAWIASNGTNDPATALVPNPMPALIGKAPGASGGAKITAMQAAEPYQAALGVTNFRSVGSSQYHALIAKVQHSLAYGLTLNANYTWSKATGTVGNASTSTFAESQQNSSSAPTGGVDYVNFNNNHSILNYDVSHRFVVSASYALPFGKGKLVNTSNGFLNEIIGGWQVSGAGTFQRGMPWGPNCAAQTASATVAITNAGTLNGRCNRVAGEPIELPKKDQHYYDGTQSLTLPNGRIIYPAVNTFMKWNPDAFSEPIVTMANGRVYQDQYNLGTTPLSIGYLRTPGIQNVNLSLIKRFPINERMGFDLHVNATNAFNHTNHQVNAADSTTLVGVITTAGTTAGRNSNVKFGSWGLSALEPRQVNLQANFTF